MVCTSVSIRLVAFDGAFRESLHFVGHHREASARFTGGCRLDSGVKREDVRLFRDVVDQFTIEPISCELSPSRLIRFEVSWIWSRMLSMPWIVWRTTSAPLAAICTERCATSADSASLRDTWSIAMHVLDLREAR
jgi:hypothetical protein